MKKVEIKTCANCIYSSYETECQSYEAILNGAAKYDLYCTSKDTKVNIIQDELKQNERTI